MSQKLWVAYETPSKTLIDRVSIEKCEHVADFLKEIKKEFKIPGSATLYKPDCQDYCFSETLY